MLIPSYKEFENILKLIHRTRNHTDITHFIDSINNKVIRSLVEIAYNILKGNIPITKRQIQKFKKHKKDLKTLISRNVPMKRKRHILKQNSNLIRDMLKVLFSLK